MAKVGVVLAGCGVYDGSEIHEAVLTLLALDKRGAEIVCMAPNGDQAHVVNHLSGEEAKGENRNMMVEAARIARGEIRDMSTVSADEVDALIFPGGFGAAKNLCDFAFKGEACSVNPEVSRLLREMISARKPIGAICIAPALLARVFGQEDIPARLTIGTDAETGDKIQKMGATHVQCPVDSFVVDEKYKIVSTPAYMLGTRISEVAEGIEKAVGALLILVR